MLKLFFFQYLLQRAQDVALTSVRYHFKSCKEPSIKIVKHYLFIWLYKCVSSPPVSSDKMSNFSILNCLEW